MALFGFGHITSTDWIILVLCLSVFLAWRGRLAPGGNCGSLVLTIMAALLAALNLTINPDGFTDPAHVWVTRSVAMGILLSNLVAASLDRKHGRLLRSIDVFLVSGWATVLLLIPRILMFSRLFP